MHLQKITRVYVLATFFIVLLFTSCDTTYHTHYTDPNYLNNNEFSDYDEIISSYSLDNEKNDLSDSNSNNYEIIDYHDFSYSSRIRRFHRPMYHTNYYGGIYTDYYWYTHNPSYWGTSIYFGYNWNNPYHWGYNNPHYWGYNDPHYWGYYYSPYYTGYYNHHYGFHHHNSHSPNYTYHNSHDANSYIYGHRGSLSSSKKNSTVKKYRSSKLIDKKNNINYTKIKKKIERNKNIKIPNNNNAYNTKTEKNRYNNSSKSIRTKSNTNRSTRSKNIRTNRKPRK